jgi:hypothetical protein
MPERHRHTLRPWAFRIGTLLLVSACASEPTGPAGPVLIGNWGSADVELIAIRAGAEVRLACATIIIDAPIALSASNTFAVRGRLDRSGAELGGLPGVDVTGSVSGTRVLVTVPGTVSGERVTFALDAGVTPAPGDVPECPL